MITNGWVDWAQHVPGIPDKVWRPNRAKKYFVNHSIEGYLGDNLVPPRFLSTERLPNGMYTPYAAASVTFVLHVTGDLIQMYSLEQSPWTSGSQEANEDGIAIESEGVAGIPLTAAQCGTYVRLMRELEPWYGFPLVRKEDGSGTIKEHRELYVTSCPSGRYVTAYEALAEDSDMGMTAAQIELDEIAGGDYLHMAECYERLIKQGNIQYEDPSQPAPPPGQDTDASATVKRFKIMSLKGRADEIIAALS